MSDALGARAYSGTNCLPFPEMAVEVILEILYPLPNTWVFVEHTKVRDLSSHRAGSGIFTRLGL